MTGLITDSDEHRLVRESVATIADKYGHEYYAERSRTGEHIGELWQELGDAGLLGVHLPEEYGGGGAGLSEFVIVVEELAAHGVPLLVAVISPAICGSILTAHASAEMKSRWLPDIASGGRKMAFALTEPDAGSNSHNVSTTARWNGTGWTLSGGKYYISAANECAALLVAARNGEQAAGEQAGMSLFVVPTDAEGLTLQPIETALVAPDKQFTVFLDDVEVPADALIGDPGNGLRQLFAGLNPERVLAAALCNGVGRYATGKASTYACERQVWSTPIGAHQGIAHPLAASYIDVETARLATAHAAQLYDSGRHAAEASNIAKYVAAEAALRALDQAIQTHGGNGLALEYGLADLWFVTRLMRTAPVSREMILNFVARHSLGLPESY
ncbi:acyl-CoA/acyl-ACP dehydrogenase [Haloechinothrix sp. YIM 98757]|uniref:Acyl-CoA/acyl-ACP dehydrogenase n=1 Tax=Haloechinothrix aidingensis TaxID=2752311 RepID=A0A838AC84_9PSEU|nr:acyl-CoA dehydrogenase family protein [Haloechinothrix aidingensis]MBA0126837.1 acyl-CoA/acyl-ACP dehydrogenase [Haloechinothrix aidingensis]